LEFLLSKQLRTDLFEPINLEDITGFVTLKRKQMTRFILTGSFHLRRAKGYLIDLVRRDRAYNVNKNELIKLVNNLSNHENYDRLKSYIFDPKAKIVVTEVCSRHKRAVEKFPIEQKPKKTPKNKKKKGPLLKQREIKNSKQMNNSMTTTIENLAKKESAKKAKSLKNRKLKNFYKVIICYLDQTPAEKEIDDLQEYMQTDENQATKRRPQKVKQIKSFICSCMNGKKIISPCMHVSATIYYLGWAKYRPLKYPAEYLNEIFLQSTDEPANKPKSFLDFLKIC